MYVGVQGMPGQRYALGPHFVRSYNQGHARAGRCAGLQVHSCSVDVSDVYSLLTGFLVAHLNSQEQQHYTVLLIITDGVINDFDNTKVQRMHFPPNRVSPNINKLHSCLFRRPLLRQVATRSRSSSLAWGTRTSHRCTTWTAMAGCSRTTARQPAGTLCSLCSKWTGGL